MFYPYLSDYKFLGIMKRQFPEVPIYVTVMFYPYLSDYKFLGIMKRQFPEVPIYVTVMFYPYLSDYKFLGIMKRQFPEVPILGLTATATVNVLEDVKKILNIPSCHLFKASFNRPNLYYEVKLLSFEPRHKKTCLRRCVTR